MMGGTDFGLPAAGLPPPQVRVNEPELVADSRFQHKRVKIGKVHRPVDMVHR